MISIKKTIKRGFKIVIRTNVTREILEVMDEYIDMLYKYFGEDDRFWYYWETAKNLGGDRIKNVSNSLLADEKKFIKYVIKASKLGMKFDFNKFVFPGGFICALYPYNYWLIDYSGDIQKCTVCFDNEKIKLGKLSGGLSCPLCENDKNKCRDCDQLKKIFNNIVNMK